MTDRPLTVDVDGALTAAAPGEVLLRTLERIAVSIPHVCHHESLGALATCDTCIVEVDGALVRACTTPVRAGMRVRTKADTARQAREEAMQRIAANHELYCTVCDYNNGDCEVHNAAKLAELEHQRYPFTPKPYAIDASNPFYRYDPSQCILCGRCVEACQNVQVTETLSIDWSAERPRVLWDGGRPINESSCVSCGHCVTVCPCNALMEKSMLGKAGHFTAVPEPVRSASIRIVKHLEVYTGFAPLFVASDAEAAMREQTIEKTKTVCTYCGVGCSFDVWTRGRDVLKVQPRPEAPANGISTCIKGKFGWAFVNSDDRLTSPLVRDAHAFRKASWDEALDVVARRLRDISERHGKDSVAFISSSKTTNEECYLVQKIARVVFGTNNVDNCARYCQSPATMALSRTVGYGGDAGTMRDIELADVVLIVGSHTATSHPVLAAHIRGQQKLRGQRLIVADIMAHEMATRADVFVRPHPGTDLIWINAVARYILDRGWEDRAFIEQRVNEFDAYVRSLEPFTIDDAVARTGVSADTLQRVAEIIARGGRVCGLWAMGLTQHHNATDTCTAISNLLLLTGNYGKPGTGGYPLRGHNNVQGSCDFGALHNYLPGYAHVENDHARAPFEREWGVRLPAKPGFNNRTVIDAIHEGKVKGLYVVGEELGLVDSNVLYVQEALRKLEFFVVQDVFFSTTAEFADVVLAGTPSFEKEGTFVNTERRIQRLYQVMSPLGDSRPDWRILRDLAARLGHPWAYEGPRDIMAEVARCAAIFAGVTYEALEGYRSLCWPVRSDGTDSPLLYTERFNFPDGKAKFHPVAYTAPFEVPDAEYDLHLNSGRVLEHFHEGNLTHRVPGMHEKVADAFVFVSPALARARGLADGDWVRLTSRRGSIKTRAVVSDSVRDGELYMPLCSSNDRVNVLTSSDADPVVDTPSYKETAVKLERLGERGASPLPRTHPRNGHPTPQRGVEVQHKWARPDYGFPTGDPAVDATKTATRAPNAPNHSRHDEA
ncbi:MAG: formate dehydrogenase subunit alpha [Polyangiaceae bacterium]|nr:formate dehydrogenase subunit alpha [Polyangiaceae bacterium]